MSILDAHAQQNLVDRDVKAAPDHDVRVGAYADIKPDCTPGTLPAIRLLVPPAHGAVAVKRGVFKATNFKQCLAAEVPALLAFYHAAGGYIGTDEFELEITTAEGRKQIEHFRVNVSNNPGGGEGI